MKFLMQCVRVLEISGAAMDEALPDAVIQRSWEM